jgi:hypothetical protein
MTEHRSKLLVSIYCILATLILGAYGLNTFLGWEWDSAREERLPESVRQTPGGYRNSPFWLSSFRGGK